MDADHPATFATKDVTVTLGDATLRYGVDYLLDYAGNTAVGTATVTVRGIDKYSGTVAKTFTIELKDAPAPKPTLTSVSVKTKPSKLTYVSTTSSTRQDWCCSSTMTTTAPAP